ncbi:peptidase M50 [Pseudodonghicola flavimaris]|uniref:Peptidase M50 n=1 Tax=Pseudodonghicola flavimaris TaxID=3050036 RepID=A0ABT7F0B1_9RHOB|nr:peptidase M50 [Pseudodonghicola flavimaris]MDK3018041.1 peptidase M50 [Pseudodonghicola flavimaris]
MTGSLHSATWYRVAELTPRLRSHAEAHRSVFRGAVWYVIEDHASGAYLRVSEAAWRIIGLMNGRRTMEEIWRAAAEALGDDLPTQDEVIQLLIRLHRSDVLHAAIPPDMEQVVQRGRQDDRKKRLASLRNPLAIRVPVLDPDNFVRATGWLVRPFFSWFGVLLWLAVVGGGLFAGLQNIDALHANIADRALTAGNLLLVLAVYPLVKAVHEMGHAYAVRHWGGEVHEIGIMFLVFMPVPYVDASASSAFRSKWQRAGVAAAGIVVELFLAGAAAMLWGLMEPGLMRAAVMNVMLLAGISTLFFNGNPLLRFDGYYVFADLIEIPNLGTRSTQHLQYLAQRYLFGIKTAVSPAMAPGEATWFTVYGTLSLVYRYMIMLTIMLLVAGMFFEVGLLLAFWAGILLLIVPAARGLRFVLASPRLEGHRLRALVVSGGLAAVVAWALFVQPVPSATIVRGVIRAPETARAVSGADGFVEELLAQPGETLAAGTPILRVTDPLLDFRVRQMDARIEELRLRRFNALASDRVQADLVAQELSLAEEERALAIERRGEQIVTAPVAGRLLLPAGDDLVGRFVRKGEALAWVIGSEPGVVRVVIPEAKIDLVRRHIDAVQMRLASTPLEPVPARLTRGTPAAVPVLPSAALATEAGGPIPVDPTAETPLTPVGTVFVMDVAPADGRPLTALGERVSVRFDHGPTPLGAQLLRALRQIFLRDLNV